MPLYNKRPFVERALKSVVDQISKVDNIYVVDDGSDDGSRELVNDLSRSHVNIALLSTQRPRSGPGASRSLGLTRCRSTFVTFLDADDWWHQTKVARQLEVIENAPRIGLVHTGCRIVGADGSTLREQSPGTPAAT